MAILSNLQILLETANFRSLEGIRRRHGGSEVRHAIPSLSDDYEEHGLVSAERGNDFKIENAELDNESVVIDLRVGNEVLISDTLMTSFSPKDCEKRKLESGEKYVLMPDADGQIVYYIPSVERFCIPSRLEMTVDSKSTTGRVGVMSHKATNLDETDFLDYPYENLDYRTIPVWVAIQPHSFPIEITSGKTSLVHTVIRNKGSKFATAEDFRKKPEIVKLRVDGKEVDRRIIEQMFEEHNGVGLTYDTDLAYEALPYHRGMKPIDMEARGLDPREHFRIIRGNGRVVMQAKLLYLLGTLEEPELSGRVVGTIAREHETSGTGLWNHFAGKINPGFSGEITSESYSHVKRVIIRGEPAGIVKFDEIEGYVKSGEGHYHGQRAPRLPKMFDEKLLAA